MKFVTDDELKLRIQDDILNDLVSQDKNILEVAENDAIDTIKSYCGKRYDIRWEIEHNTNRNRELVSMITDHIAYDVYSRASVIEVQDIREQRYNTLMNKLKAIQKGECTPSFKLLEFDLDKDSIKPLFGSNRRQNVSVW